MSKSSINPNSNPVKFGEIPDRYRQVLKFLAQHDNLRVANVNNEFTIHWKTAQHMLVRGWIEWTDFHYDYVRLTPAGRLALATPDAPKTEGGRDE